MYKKTAKRDKRGKIIHEVASATAPCHSLSSLCLFGAGVNTLLHVKQDLQSKELPNTRIQPDRRWFGNTRVVGQKQLEQFREEMSTKARHAALRDFHS